MVPEQVLQILVAVVMVEALSMVVLVVVTLV